MEQNKDIFSPMPLRLYITQSQNCSYLKEQTEQRLATDISLHPEDYIRFAETGFRRIENWVYRPVCPNCNACKPIRIICRDVVLTRNLTRIKNKNKDLTRSLNKQGPTKEHYELFSYYLSERHQDGEMRSMSFDEFSTMILNSPIKTCLLEYRLKSGELRASILIDIQRDGISAVYSFFDPDCSKRSLGHFMIIDLIQVTLAMGLPYLYLGYYIEQSQKMAYKARFRPYQIFTDGQWQDQP